MIVKKLVFLSILLIPILSVGNGFKDQDKRIISDLIKKSGNEIFLSPYLAHAYYYEFLENDSSSFFMDALGFYASSNPPKNNAMLFKFFFPYNMRKSDQDSCWKELYDKTCMKKQLRILNNLPSEYRNLISDYRWFLRVGPFSEYSNHYEYAIDSTYTENDKDFVRIRYNLKKPIGRLPVISGWIYYNSGEGKLLKIVSDKNRHFSCLFHKNVPAEIEIKFSYTPSETHCYFSSIKSKYFYKGIHGQFSLQLLKNPVVAEYSDSEIKFLRNMNFRPYVFYSKQEWDKFSINNQNRLLKKEEGAEDVFKKNSNKFYFKYNDEDIKDSYSPDFIQEQMQHFENIYKSNSVIK